MEVNLTNYNRLRSILPMQQKAEHDLMPLRCLQEMYDLNEILYEIIYIIIKRELYKISTVSYNVRYT